MLLDSVVKKDNDYYPKIFLEEKEKDNEYN